MNLKKNIQEVISYISTVNEWRNDFSDPRRKKADSLNQLLYGESFQKIKGCGCIDDFLNVLTFWNDDKIKLKIKQMAGLYRMKKGELVGFGGSHYTEANMTDNKAIEILSRFPNLIDLFDEFPENWNKKKEVRTNREIELYALNKSELRELCVVIAVCKEIESPKKKSREKTLVDFIIINE